jgi:RHH-type rel operon transcriptional repressor/antitoxin RelB
MIEAIKEHIGDLEALYVAEQRLIQHRAGRSRSFTQREMEKRYGVAD